MLLRHTFLPVRTSLRAASDRRSSPRALCLLHTDLRAGERWEAGDPALVRAIELGEPAARLSSAYVVAWLGACVLALRPLGEPQLTPRIVLRRRAADELRPREDVDLSRDEQALLLALWARRESMTHFQRLGLAPTADAAAIRRAYLDTCRRLHPDRYFGKRMGPFAAALAELFDRARLAYAVLSDPRRRARYLGELVAAGHRVDVRDADATA